MSSIIPMTQKEMSSNVIIYRPGRERKSTHSFRGKVRNGQAMMSENVIINGTNKPFTVKLVETVPP